MTTAGDDYIAQVLAALPLAFPRRQAIAAELRSHIHDRLASGNSIDEVLRQLGDAAVLAESYVSAVPLVSASFAARAAAKIVDSLLIVGLALVVVAFAWLNLPHEALPFVIAGDAIVGSILFGVYTMVAEAWYGQTFGKRLFGLRVVREAGTQISGGQAIVRQLPMFLQVYAVDVLFSLFTERSQRAFELLSKTRVVTDTSDRTP